MKKLLTGIAVMFIAITAFARISYAATPEVYGKPGTDYVAFNVDTALAHK